MGELSDDKGVKCRFCLTPVRQKNVNLRVNLHEFTVNLLEFNRVFCVMVAKPRQKLVHKLTVNSPYLHSKFTVSSHTNLVHWGIVSSRKSPVLNLKTAKILSEGRGL